MKAEVGMMDLCGLVGVSTGCFDDELLCLLDDAVVCTLGSGIGFCFRRIGSTLGSVVSLVSVGNVGNPGGGCISALLGCGIKSGNGSVCSFGVGQIAAQFNNCAILI